jgi:hypothetical protein
MRAQEQRFLLEFHSDNFRIFSRIFNARMKYPDIALMFPNPARHTAYD